MKLTAEQRQGLVYLSNLGPDEVAPPGRVMELMRLGLVELVDCSDGDYFELTDAGRAALQEEQR